MGVADSKEVPPRLQAQWGEYKDADMDLEIVEVDDEGILFEYGYSVPTWLDDADKKKVVKALHSLPLPRKLTKYHVVFMLASLEEHSVPEGERAKRILCQGGEKSRGIVILLAGSAKVYVDIPRDEDEAVVEEVQIHTLRPGDFFGEVSTIFQISPLHTVDVQPGSRFALLPSEGLVFGGERDKADNADEEDGDLSDVESPPTGGSLFGRPDGNEGEEEEEEIEILPMHMGQETASLEDFDVSKLVDHVLDDDKSRRLEDGEEELKTKEGAAEDAEHAENPKSADVNRDDVPDRLSDDQDSSDSDEGDEAYADESVDLLRNARMRVWCLKRCYIDSRGAGYLKQRVPDYLDDSLPSNSIFFALSRVPFFKEFPYLALLRLTDNIPVHLAMPGSIIMKYGTPTAVLPVVLTGEVELQSASGDYLGEFRATNHLPGFVMSLLPFWLALDQPYTAITTSLCQLCFLDKDMICDALDEVDDDISEAACEFLRERMTMWHMLGETLDTDFWWKNLATCDPDLIVSRALQIEPFGRLEKADFYDLLVNMKVVNYQKGDIIMTALSDKALIIGSGKAIVSNPGEDSTLEAAKANAGNMFWSKALAETASLQADTEVTTLEFESAPLMELLHIAMTSKDIERGKAFMDRTLKLANLEAEKAGMLDGLDDKSITKDDASDGNGADGEDDKGNDGEEDADDDDNAEEDEDEDDVDDDDSNDDGNDNDDGEQCSDEEGDPPESDSEPDSEADSDDYETIEEYTADEDENDNEGDENAMGENEEIGEEQSTDVSRDAGVGEAGPTGEQQQSAEQAAAVPKDSSPQLSPTA